MTHRPDSAASVDAPEVPGSPAQGGFGASEVGRKKTLLFFHCLPWRKARAFFIAPTTTIEKEGERKKKSNNDDVGGEESLLALSPLRVDLFPGFALAAPERSQHRSIAVGSSRNGGFGGRDGGGHGK